MLPTKVPEIIAWKYPEAKFIYQGDGVQIKKHDNNGDACEGLVWLDDNINKPTKAQIDSWRANAEKAYKFKDVREKRDNLLAQSDYVMMVDYPMEDKSAWEAYRQELRDLPASNDDPDLIVFPERP
jgi:hypothetical protein